MPSILTLLQIDEAGWYGTYGEIGGDENLPDMAALNIAYGEAHSWETTIPAGVPTSVMLLVPAAVLIHETVEAILLGMKSSLCIQLVMKVKLSYTLIAMCVAFHVSLFMLIKL